MADFKLKRSAILFYKELKEKHTWARIYAYEYTKIGPLPKLSNIEN